MLTLIKYLLLKLKLVAPKYKIRAKRFCAAENKMLFVIACENEPRVLIKTASEIYFNKNIFRSLPRNALNEIQFFLQLELASRIRPSGIIVSA
jgi:hypothetical protein